MHKDFEFKIVFLVLFNIKIWLVKYLIIKKGYYTWHNFLLSMHIYIKF